MNATDIPRPDRWVRSTANRHPLAAAVLTVGLAGVWAASGYPVPVEGIPPGVKVATAAGVATAPVGVLAGRKVVDLLYDPDRIYLVDVDGGTGDLAVYALSPTVWRETSVVSPGGERLERSDLHRIEIYAAARAYEVVDYSPDSRVATASPAAGLSEIDMREHEHAVEHIIDDLAPLADSYAELRSGLRPMVRSILEEIVTWQISTLESDDVPRGGVIGEVVDGEIDDVADEFPDPAPVGDVEPGEAGSPDPDPMGLDGETPPADGDWEWGER